MSALEFCRKAKHHRRQQVALLHIERIIREVRPRGLFLENVPGLVRGDSNLYSEAWPKAGSMRSGVVSKQAMLEPAIEENDSSFWPTVTTQEYPHYDMKLNAKGRRIPKKGKDRSQREPGRHGEVVGTPRASEWKGTDPPGSASHKHRLDRHYLDAQSEDFHHRPMIEKPGQKSSENDPTSHRRLNPKFVEWLMGCPRTG